MNRSLMTALKALRRFQFQKMCPGRLLMLTATFLSIVLPLIVAAVYYANVGVRNLQALIEQRSWS